MTQLEAIPQECPPAVWVLSYINHRGTDTNAIRLFTDKKKAISDAWGLIMLWPADPALPQEWEDLRPCLESQQSEEWFTDDHVIQVFLQEVE